MIDGHGDDGYRYGGVRLNFSSNIPAFAHLADLEEHLKGCMSLIRSYPEPAARSLEGRIAEALGRTAAEVVVTSGATEAIYLIAQAAHLAPKGRAARTYTVVHPTFSEYDSACQNFGMEESDEGELCWLCNPNNPTGEVHGEDFVGELAQRHRWLVVDRSYEDYTCPPCPPPWGSRGLPPGVITVHSMTKKYGLPGLRLGYVVARPEVADVLRSLQRPWAVNALALEAGRWLLERRPRLVDMPSFLAEAQRLRTSLNALPAIAVRPTQTHFMLCTIEGRTAAELKEYLVGRHGILIRDASNFRGLTANHFRVAAQRPEENDELVRAIGEIED